MNYAEFIAAKQRRSHPFGRDCDPAEVHPFLHPWQAELVAWAVKQGRAALWADTGLGKTVMQLEWARLSGENALIVAPLAVCQQTVREAAKIGINTGYVREQPDRPGLWVTSYEMTSRFDPARLDAVVLDESSILKDVNAKTRDRLIAEFSVVPNRLACTATPAPNDHAELANHAEFLGVAARVEVLATYFVHDQDGWRLKGHAKGPFFEWMAGWATALRSPADLGYDAAGYDLPPLNITPHLLDVDVIPEGQLFATDLGGVGGRAKVRRATLDARVGRVVDLVQAEPDEPWLLWCGLNDEANTLAARLPDAVNVEGSWTPEAKAAALLAFADGQISTLITKPSIAAFGLNWQHCARMAFVGLSDSYETYYQSIRRCWRYGQTRPVDVHVVLSSLEGQIAVNIARKERDAQAVTSGLVAALAKERNAA